MYKGIEKERMRLIHTLVFECVKDKSPEFPVGVAVCIACTLSFSLFAYISARGSNYPKHSFRWIVINGAEKRGLDGRCKRSDGEERHVAVTALYEVSGRGSAHPADSYDEPVPPGPTHISRTKIHQAVNSFLSFCYQIHSKNH